MEEVLVLTSNFTRSCGWVSSYTL